jgi:hypothetical protein
VVHCKCHPVLHRWPANLPANGNILPQMLKSGYHGPRAHGRLDSVEILAVHTISKRVREVD